MPAALKGGAWTVSAAATIVATGGCAFLGGGLGCDVLTGDGQLMAAEVGAELSGMEFSNSYAIAPKLSSVTKTAFYRWATFLRADGSVLEGAGGQSRSPIARALLHERVYAILDRAEPALWPVLRQAQPNFFLPFDRAGTWQEVVDAVRGEVHPYDKNYFRTADVAVFAIDEISLGLPAALKTRKHASIYVGPRRTVLETAPGSWGNSPRGEDAAVAISRPY